jgi:undecaprenyl-diphosphatase
MPSSLGQLLAAIVLGVVQGVSEWLPVSSKTQIILVSQYVLGLNFQQAYAFGLFMEIGTVLAAIIYFRGEVWSLVRALAGKGSEHEWELFKFVLVTTAVTGVVAVPLFVVVERISSGYNIGLPMMVLGVILFLDALVIKYSRSKYAEDKNRKALEDISVRDYVLVGIVQGLATLPGVSRSGTTTSTMLLLNIEVKEAFRLSFLTGIFASAAAFFVTLIFSNASVYAAVSGLSTAGILVAIAVSTVVSLLLIDFLLGVAGRARIVYLIVALGTIALTMGALISLFPLSFSAG